MWPLKWRGRKSLLRGPRRPRDVFGRPYWITGYGMSADGRRGLLLFEQRMAVAWDIDASEQMWVPEPDTGVGHGAVSDDGRWCVISGRGVRTRWSLDDRECVGGIDARPPEPGVTPEWMSCWYLAPGGTHALTSDGQHLLRRWNLRDETSSGAIALNAKITAVAAHGDDVVLGTVRGDIIALRHHPGTAG